MNYPMTPSQDGFRPNDSREHESRTHSNRCGCKAQDVTCPPVVDAAPLSTLHNLILSEVFRAQPKTLTITELFYQTQLHPTHQRQANPHQTSGQQTDVPLTASAPLDFARAVVRLEEEGLLKPVSPQASVNGDAENSDPRFIESAIKSAITTKGETYLFSQLLLGLLPAEALVKLAQSGIANGPAPLVEPTGRPVTEPTAGPAIDHTIRHAPAGPEGKGGDTAPKLTSPPSIMEQLFPEIFRVEKRSRTAEQEEEDTCHCGEPADRTCPCGASTCQNHFYDGEGNLARRDERGFCAECVDLIREEAAGIERYGRTQ